MNYANAIGLVLCLVIALFLVAALLFPERFLVKPHRRGLNAFLLSLIIALAAVHVPLGDYMFRVYTSEKHSRAERLIYKAIGADPEAEQNWGAYARSALAFFRRLAAVPVLLPARAGKNRKRE